MPLNSSTAITNLQMSDGWKIAGIRCVSQLVMVGKETHQILQV